MGKCCSGIRAPNRCGRLNIFRKSSKFSSLMGCFHSKCCRRYPSSSDDDNKEEVGVHPDETSCVVENAAIEFVDVPSSNFRLSYCVLCQTGQYPDSPDKENQDCYCIKTSLQGNPNVHFFGVFVTGTQCSNFAKSRLVEILENDKALLDDPVKAYSSAFVVANDELHNNSEIDDSMSGTTAITALVVGDRLYVANVGDSRAVLAVKDKDGVRAQDLSYDQTPFRKDECERVKFCGARVLSVDQVEGNKDQSIQSWGDEIDGSDPPRLWLQNAMYPGTAFTRSLGDNLAESIGVIADPEVSMIHLTSNHKFFVVASDGVFEFLSSQTVVDMVNKYSDPRDACSAIAQESYKLWFQNDNRTDDMTLILVHIKDLND